jgi:hypothetical protein
MIRQGNAQLDRVLKHATSCKVLQLHDVDLWQDAIEASGQGALGAKLMVMTPTEESIELVSEPSSKKLKSQSTLDVDRLRDVGKKARDEQVQHYQARVDHVIMRLICVRGLVPNVTDSSEWKELMGLLNDVYHPTSADTFADKHIPREAVFVRQQQIEKLRTINNLSLSFDGTGTRRQDSLYTVHATTPSRESYFLDAYQGSDERHTTEWVKDKLLKVCSAQFCVRLYSFRIIDDTLSW